MTRILILVSVILFSVCRATEVDFLQDDYINEINEEATSWKAGSNFDPNTTLSTILSMLGSKAVEKIDSISPEEYKVNDEFNPNWLRHLIPPWFDARKIWRRCKSIGEIRDQGRCGSCWAVATTSAFADRLCIATHGKFNQQVSAEELTFCCKPPCGWGCNGGYPDEAWKFFSTHGVVTGGNYNTTEGCQPYNVEPCPYFKNGTNSCKGKRAEKNHVCRYSCYGNKQLSFTEDHRYTRDFYRLSYSTIQRDVLLYGPVEASFQVYSDFLSYKSGVYIKTRNARYLGGHAVKLIGWGTENGVPYWLMANSWNEGWGDKGYFKIRRGTNECMVDVLATAGVPDVY